MNNQEYAEARRIFDEYNGSYFQMEREGVYKNYKRFDVPKELEKSWIDEIQNNIRQKLNLEQNGNEIVSFFSKLNQIACHNNDMDSISYLVEFAENNQHKLDSFSNVILAESILNSIGNFDHKYRQSVVNSALSLLKNLSKTQIRISDSYKENGIFPDYIAESKIAERIDRNIKYWEKEVK